VAERIFFIVFAGLAVLGALGVVTRKNIVHALILLIFTFVNIAAIYLLSQAYFLAVAQILVYAGAILILFTFVVMFLNIKEYQEAEQLHPIQKFLVFILAPITAAEFIAVAVTATWAASGGEFTPEAIAAAGGNVKVLGQVLFTQMLLPFEIAALVLLAGMVGAVVLAQKEKAGSLAQRQWGPDEQPTPDFMEQEV
jgi:NADH-quinone oxidoreductase subunit J